MTSSLDVIFRELGLSQYLDHFIDQGFDTWETILDVQESDLDALNVKLGHRRKLQRRIANSRGLAPQVSLASPTQQSIEDGRLLDANRSEPSLKSDGRDGSSAKRKYRRHPKPDENAPERPPSAYVLFSNKMRDDLKGRQLTFTEIAKLVGENWQSLSPAEREPYETKAQEDKERYNRELADYKKTEHYERYCEYLNEFKKRQALQSQEKDAAKRLKAENSESNRASAGSGSSGSPQNSNRSPNSDDGQTGEPAPNCQHQFAPTTLDFLPNINGRRQLDYSDETGASSAFPLTSDNLARNRNRGLSSPHSHELSLPNGTRAGWASSLRTSAEAPGTKLPWFQGTEHRAPFSSTSSSGDSKPLPSLSSTPNHGSRSSISSGFASASRPPSLKTEPSSSGSMSSTSYSLPRTPSDASLPIHALLSSKPEPAYLTQPMPPIHSSPQSSMLGYNSATASQDVPMLGMHTTQPHGPIIPPLSKAPIPQESLSFSGLPGRLPEPNIGGPRDAGLDGISALLRARDIVERRPS